MTDKIRPELNLKINTMKYKIFKTELNRLLQKTQIGGTWSVTFTDKEDLGGSLAKCTYSMMNRWVRFSFNPEEHKNLPRSDQVRAARHEFGHFVIARLETLALYRFTTEDEIIEESEAIARIFEKL